MRHYGFSGSSGIWLDRCRRKSARSCQKRADSIVIDEYADWDQEPEDLLWWADALGHLEVEESWWIDWLDRNDAGRLEWRPQMSPLRAAMIARGRNRVAPTRGKR